MNSSRQILVTSALPYANGPIHLGHMVEYIQTDIWVRFQKMRGNDCIYICADDAHGTAIMLRAEKEGISEQTLIDKSRTEHHHDFKGFLVNFNEYYSTHSPENQAHSNAIYEALQRGGYIIKKTILQPFDDEKKMFLPDRYIKGTCPKCKAPDQYGDNCEVCGTTYQAMELIEPYSVLSKKTPILAETEHFFFDLPQFSDFLQNWLKSASLQESMRNKLAEWFEAGLKAWDITRDAPYWGFEIPNEPNKYFYVWLDAPVGYFGALDHYCQKNNLNVQDYIKADSEIEMYHFIGKDIAYFHMLFWPAMLKGANLRLPTGVFCHGFLTVNGEKMSKSRGTFIQAKTYLKHLNPEYLRYYFSSKLNSKVEDIDLNLEDFKGKVNSDLVGKLVNLASRSAPFISKHFNGQLSAQLKNDELLKRFMAQSEIIADYYEKREYSFAIKEIMQLIDEANIYIDAEKPWIKVKDEHTLPEVQEIATVGLNAFYLAMIYLSPVLPNLSQAVAELFNLKSLEWADSQKPLLNIQINAFKPLMQRIEDASISAIIADSQEDLKAENQKQGTQMNNEENNWIKIDDFQKLDIRVAKVLSCSMVEGSEKLLHFKLDVGELGEREVFSGIKAYHSPEELIGQLVIYLANLSPRKMGKFGMSTGMILSASDNETLQVLLASGRAKAGMKIS